MMSPEGLFHKDLVSSNDTVEKHARLVALKPITAGEGSRTLAAEVVVLGLQFILGF